MLIITTTKFLNTSTTKFPFCCLNKIRIDVRTRYVTFSFLQIVKNKCKKSSNGSKKISYLSKKLSNQSKNQLIQLILVEQTFFSHFIHLKTQSVYCNHYCLRIKLDRSIRSSVPFGHFELGWTWQWPWLWSCSQFWHTAVLTAPPVINQLPKQ